MEPKNNENVTLIMPDGTTYIMTSEEFVKLIEEAPSEEIRNDILDSPAIIENIGQGYALQGRWRR